MSIDERIRTALQPIVSTVSPNLYDGPETEYIVYQYDEAGILYAGDRPRMILFRLMVHLFLPTGQNPRSLKRRIREALHEAGGTWPAVTNAGDRDGQHYVFECEMMEGNEPDG